MESKKTFGEYIRERRKLQGLTQKEFAEQLYVTESAVSKWERGLSYPDITLLLDICAALDVTEHELLTASEDTNKRAAERLAEKYQRLTRNFCVFMCFLYGGILASFVMVCLINSDFLILAIAAAAVMIAASVTALPFLLARKPDWEPYKWTVSLGAMVFSGELLLLACCVRSGSMHVFLPVAMWILTGASFLLLPVILSITPLPPFLAHRRASLYFAVDLVLLLLTLLAMNFNFFHSGQFAVAAPAAVFGLGFIAFPVFLRQLPLPEPLCRCKTSLFIGIQSVLLLLLLLVCCHYAGGAAWDVCPAVLVGVLFGLSAAFLPIPLRQLPLPEKLRRHKALLYFTVNTALLFVVLAVATGEWFFPMSLPSALLGLILPWGLMAIIRYLPVNGWFRASLSCAWAGLWSWLFPWMMDRILNLNGWPNSTPYRLSLPADLSRWEDPQTTGWNIFLLVLIGIGLLAAGFAVAGAARMRKRDKT